MIQPVCATNFCTKKHVAKKQPTFKGNKIYVIADSIAKQKEPISTLGKDLVSKFSALETGVAGKFNSIMEGLSEKTTDFLENAAVSFSSTTSAAETVAQFRPRGAILNHFVGDSSIIIKLWAKDAKPVEEATIIDANNFYTPIRSLEDLKGVELSAEDIAELRQIPGAIEILDLPAATAAEVSFKQSYDGVDSHGDDINTDEATNPIDTNDGLEIDGLDLDVNEDAIELLGKVADLTADIA